MREKIIKIYLDGQNFQKMSWKNLEKNASKWFYKSFYTPDLILGKPKKVKDVNGIADYVGPVSDPQRLYSGHYALEVKRRLSLKKPGDFCKFVDKYKKSLQCIRTMDLNYSPFFLILVGQTESYIVALDSLAEEYLYKSWGVLGS